MCIRDRTYTIGDGLIVSLLPKKTRGGTVVVNAEFRFADLEAMRRSPPIAADFAGGMLMRGSKDMSREQIDKRFEALKTAAGISGSSQGASINLETRRGELAEALTVAADILRNPAFPDSEFEQLRLQAITGMAASYTHLDVYKRQPAACAMRQNPAFQRSTHRRVPSGAMANQMRSAPSIAATACSTIPCAALRSTGITPCRASHGPSTGMRNRLSLPRIDSFTPIPSLAPNPQIPSQFCLLYTSRCV